MAMLIPASVDIIYNNKDWEVFVLSSAIAIFLGGLMSIPTRDVGGNLNKRELLILIPLAWITMPSIATLPIYTSELGLSFTDAYFESLSGMTTTGATILSNLDNAPPGILLWRSILQWMGGIGIVIMASGLLPIAQVGGMQLLQLEFDSRMEKILPRTAQLSLVIVLLYSAITLVCACLYFIFGMSGFDAINHAMTTVATGGYSTHDASIGYFNNDKIVITSIIFMIISSFSFVMIITTVRGQIGELFRDVQAKWLITILSTVTIYMVYKNINSFDNLYDNILHTTFTITSLITGTGYTTFNYNLWGTVTIPLLVLIMIMGGSAGSTTCGIKMFRLKIMFETINSYLKNLIQPNGVFLPYYGKKSISQDVSISVIGYLVVFLFTLLIFTIIFSALGYDIVTALSAASSALSCVGPGIGEIIGPNSNYGDVSTSFKWVFTFGMLIGRLEIFTVLVLLSPSFWNK
ncbi:MAG: TrkH family potassium uptake protein [Alphaproteobacteria bacterium]|nr:TrkH family potassium uptake protein [Alphaproteobacteria bacterium]